MSKGYKNPAHRKGKLKIAFNPLEKRSLVLKGMQIDIGLSLPPGASGIRQSSERLLVRTRELSGTAGGRMNRYYPPPRYLAGRTPLSPRSPPKGAGPSDTHTWWNCAGALWYLGLAVEEVKGGLGGNLPALL